MVNCMCLCVGISMAATLCSCDGLSVWLHDCLHASVCSFDLFRVYGCISEYLYHSMTVSSLDLYMCMVVSMCVCMAACMASYMAVWLSMYIWMQLEFVYVYGCMYVCMAV